MSTKSSTPPVLQVEGKEIKLKFSIAAFRIAKDQHGVSFSIGDLSNVGLDILPRFVWVAMLPFQPDLSEQEGMDLLLKAENESDAYPYVMGEFSRFKASLAFIAGNAKGAATGKK